MILTGSDIAAVISQKHPGWVIWKNRPAAVKLGRHGGMTLFAESYTDLERQIEEAESQP